jgi:hypothetical protein
MLDARHGGSSRPAGGLRRVEVLDVAADHVLHDLPWAIWDISVVTVRPIPML